MSVIGTVFVTMFFIIGIRGYVSKGFPNRKYVDIYRDFENDIEKIGYRKCESSELNEGERINYCYETNNGSVNAVIIGDSHAADKFYGIEKTIVNFNWGLIGNSSCPPVLNIDVEGDQKNCRLKFEKILKFVVNNSSIKTVVLSYFGNYPLTTAYAADHIENKVGPDVIKISSQKITTKDRIEMFYFGLSETVKMLIASNKKVYLLVDVPELPYFPMNCVRGSSKCAVLKSEVLERQKQHREIIKRIEKSFPELVVFDPIDIFCNEKTCSYKNGKSILYKDSHHLTFKGSDLYAQSLKKMISSH